MSKKAVVMLSGGLDSSTALAIAIDEGYDCFPISFDYEQRHKIELEFAKRQCKDLGLSCQIVLCDFGKFGGSALTDKTIEVPTHDHVDELDDQIPVTYVPGRNTIFLAYSLSYAETLDADAVYVGMNALDYSGYPDCRPEYVDAYQELCKYSSKRGVEGNPIEIKAPLILKTKVEIIQTGTALGVNYSLTSSCYDPTPNGLACGKCDSCLLRKQGFADAGVPDPDNLL